MRIDLIDGTYELFRMYFGAPPYKVGGREVGAARALVRSLAMLLRDPAVTHVAVAFDHVIESFRNALFDGYKTGAGIEPELFAQFPLAERAAAALGVVVWPMVEFEADDALGTASARWREAPGVEQIRIGSPDKDLAQCVVGSRVVLWDRRRELVIDEPGVVAKWGVKPESIPDLLALIGDDADGIPGVPKWGARSAAAVLGRYVHLDAIPPDAAAWDVKVRGAEALAASLAKLHDEVRLYRTLATLRVDVPLPEHLDDLRWRGPDAATLATVCAELGLEPAGLQLTPRKG